jgi:hypothetical protein
MVILKYSDMEKIKLKNMPEPIGKWLIENAKKSFPTESGTYYHYVEVCRLLQLMKDQCGNKQPISSLLPQKCNCEQNCLPYDAIFTIKKCKRCGNDC